MPEEIVESEDSSFLCSCPLNKSINDKSSLSECEGAKTCLFEPHDSELTKLDMQARRGATLAIAQYRSALKQICCIANSVHY